MTTNTLHLTKNYLFKYSAVILDLSGTIIDFGVHVPFLALSNAFMMNGINIPSNKIRKNMGINNQLMIKNLCNQYNVPNKYYSVYKEYENQLYVLNTCKEHTTPINQAVETTINLKKHGFKIGLTTNYNRNVFNLIEKSLSKHGFVFDVIACNNDVLCEHNDLLTLQKVVYLLDVPHEQCLKIGESSLNILEGLYANIDTLNLIDSSNAMGMDEQHFDDTCEKIKCIKRMDIINKLMNNNMPKYYAHNIGEINKLLLV